MKASRIVSNKFKFRKNQTIFIVETDFYISVRKMLVLEFIEKYEYEAYDDWDSEYFWTCGNAIRVIENGHEEIIPLDKFDCNSFVTTSSRDALKVVKIFSNKIDHYNLQTKSYFVTEWT